MTDLDNRASAGPPTHAQHDDAECVDSFSLNGQTVLFDADDPERWIQSDTAIALEDIE